MLKNTYPKSQPSPLRITTHTIKAMFGCENNKEKSLDKNVNDFKLNLLTLSSNLNIDSNIKYIEYVTKSNNYIVEFFPEIPLKISGDPIKDIENNTQNYASAIEAMVRLSPEQYFWVHNRWKTQPYCVLKGN